MLMTRSLAEPYNQLSGHGERYGWWNVAAYIQCPATVVSRTRGRRKRIRIRTLISSPVNKPDSLGRDAHT